MRTLVIGDIHGGLKALEQVLDRAAITASVHLIFMGDYVDGWSESAAVVRYLMALSTTNSCVFIKGNHDVWCEKWLRYGIAEPVWLDHGGREAVKSYQNISTEEKEAHLAFFGQLKPYHIDAQNRLYVHAGFTSHRGVAHELNESTFYFDRSLWEMALAKMAMGEQSTEKYPPRLKLYNEIYIGHTPTLRYHKETPMQALNIWNVDTGAAFQGALSAMDINSKAIFQSEQLPELYPDEKGRNERSLNQILGRQ